MTNDSVLRSLYYNPEDQGSFGGVDKLYRRAKQFIPNITLNEVKDWLKSELTYTLHKPVRLHFKREKVFVSSINEQFQADLVDMQAFSKQNNGNKWILTCIDCFSKYAFAEPLLNKGGVEVKKALEKIFQVRKPFILQTDRGSEFTNRIVQKFLEENDVHYFTTYNSKFKCSIVERFNRTLKSLMFRYFTKKGTRKYIDVLEELVHNYNNSFHRSIKSTPAEVNEDNQKQIFENLYGVETEREYIFNRKEDKKIKIGDFVRLQYDFTPFDKKYYPNWKDMVFTVSKIIKGVDRPRYEVIDDKGNTFERRLYPEELQVINKPVYRIEKLIRKVKQNGRTGYIVKWLGYPSSYNSFVPIEDIQDV